jgi:hypothetical protein
VLATIDEILARPEHEWFEKETGPLRAAYESPSSE